MPVKAHCCPGNGAVSGQMLVSGSEVPQSLWFVMNVDNWQCSPVLHQIKRNPETIRSFGLFGWLAIR